MVPAEVGGSVTGQRPRDSQVAGVTPARALLPVSSATCPERGRQTVPVSRPAGQCLRRGPTGTRSLSCRVWPAGRGRADPQAPQVGAGVARPLRRSCLGGRSLPGSEDGGTGNGKAGPGRPPPVGTPFLSRPLSGFLDGFPGRGPSRLGLTPRARRGPCTPAILGGLSAMRPSDQLRPAGHVPRWGEGSGKGLAVPEPATSQRPRRTAGQACRVASPSGCPGCRGGEGDPVLPRPGTCPPAASCVWGARGAQGVSSEESAPGLTSGQALTGFWRPGQAPGQARAPEALPQP